MTTALIWVAAGFILGSIALVVYAACRAGGQADRDTERRL